MNIVEQKILTSSATSKYLRIAPTKLDRIIKNIRGKTYKEASQYLQSIPQDSSGNIWKTLRSAAANAAQKLNSELKEIDSFLVDQAFVNQGSIMKRIQARARGKAYRIEKKFSHITIQLKTYL